jgi:hypothetical protein
MERKLNFYHGLCAEKFINAEFLLDQILDVFLT